MYEVYDRDFFMKNVTNVYIDDISYIFVTQLLIMCFIGGMFGYLVYDLLCHENAVYIVRGLPGSGKTHWIDRRMNHINSSSIVIDMNAYTTRDGDSLRRAHVRALDVFLHLLNKGDVYTNIFVEGIFSRGWEYEMFETLARQYNRRVYLVEIVGPDNFNEMSNRSSFMNTSLWDMRWCEFQRDNWEVDNRAHFIDLQRYVTSSSEEDSGIGDSSEGCDVDGVREDESDCRYNLRSRARH